MLPLARLEISSKESGTPFRGPSPKNGYFMRGRKVRSFGQYRELRSLLPDAHRGSGSRAVEFVSTATGPCGSAAETDFRTTNEHQILHPEPENGLPEARDGRMGSTYRWTAVAVVPTPRWAFRKLLPGADSERRDGKFHGEAEFEGAA